MKPYLLPIKLIIVQVIQRWCFAIEFDCRPKKYLSNVGYTVYIYTAAYNVSWISSEVSVIDFYLLHCGCNTCRFCSRYLCGPTDPMT